MKITRPPFTKKLNLEEERDKMLNSLGWTNSIKDGLVVDENNDPIPWYSYSMIYFLKERLKKMKDKKIEIDVFEYGSGFSTLFYSKLCNSVTSVEVSSDCYEWLKGVILDFKIKNANVSFVESLDFSRSIDKFNKKFNLIVIDNKDRIECAKFSISFLTEDGIILLDNSEREKYRKIYDILEEKGFNYIDFFGSKPLSGNLSKSTIFYKRNNCFDL